jgi:hypothetical protein
MRSKKFSIARTGRKRWRKSPVLLLSGPLLAAAPAASAAIIYTPVNGGSGLTVGAEDLVGFSPLTGTVGGGPQDFYLFFQAQYLTCPALVGKGYSNPLFLIQADHNPNNFYAFKHAAGYSISAGYLSFFQTSYLNQTLNTGYWQPDGSKAYAGLEFVTNPGGGQTVQFGWVELSYNVDQTVTLYGFAYDNSGAAIAAGAVPEPAEDAALGALLAGCAAAYAARRRRRIQAP